VRGGVGEFEPGEDPLAHLVRGHGVQRHVGDDAEGAQRDHRAVEPVAVRFPAQDADLAVGGDQFERADRGAEAAVGVAGAVGAGGDRAGHRNVRQGGHVGQGAVVRRQIPGEFGVADGGGDPDRTGGAVDVELGRQRGEFEEIAVGVRDLAEGMAAAECLDPVAAGDEGTQLRQARRTVHPRRREGEVARPVGSHCAASAIGGPALASPDGTL
jgi:hypothetical protein